MIKYMKFGAGLSYALQRLSVALAGLWHAGGSRKDLGNLFNHLCPELLLHFKLFQLVPYNY